MRLRSEQRAADGWNRSNFLVLLSSTTAVEARTRGLPRLTNPGDVGFIVGAEMSIESVDNRCNRS
jgi:hypothetical protein